MTVVRTPSELAVAFRANGMKITPQRMALFELLHDHTGHPTADALFEAAQARIPGISLRTVYQTVADLTAMGELNTVNFGGATRFDPNTSDHQHAVCTSCGAVLDVQLDLGALAHDVDGFVTDSAHVVLRGQCRQCTGPRSPATDNPQQGAQQ